MNWRKGIGSALYISAMSELLPRGGLVWFITRNINDPMKAFAQKFKFTKCERMPEGYDPNFYVGYQKVIEAKEE